MFWTKARERRCVRGKDGKFRNWIGGYRKQDLKKQVNNFQGIATHIGKEFVRQTGRVAKIGDIVRKKKSDGTYHKGAYWYVRTRFGWRRAGMKRPTAAEIKEILKKARKGRK